MYLSSFFLELKLLLGTHAFLAQCLARQGMSSSLVFLGGVPFFFGAQCLARKSKSSFVLELILFLGSHIYLLFGTMFGPKKYEFLFFELIFSFGDHTFFGTMLGPIKV